MRVTVEIKYGQKEEILGWDTQALVIRLSDKTNDSDSIDELLIAMLSSFFAIATNNVKPIKSTSTSKRVLEIDTEKVPFYIKISELPLLEPKEK